MRPEEIVTFWFSEHARPWWFSQSDAFDTLLRVRFGAMYEAACAGELDHWAQTPVGSLGLVILLDQLSRNLNRDDDATYAQDDRALALTRAAIAQGQHEQLPLEQRKFLYMPFMHTEDAEAQEEGIPYWKSLDDAFTLWFARLHQIVVERFGRFPHRDRILGRMGTTKAEWDAIEQVSMTFGEERPESAR